MTYSIAQCFTTSYTAAREMFLDAAGKAGASVISVPHPGKGPDGEALFMDFACLGGDESKTALVVVSGTHGVEGFCGSGVQVNLLRSPDALAKLKNTKLILVHGHNPHGFAWLRRTNEDNIDLNRNYVDFSEPQEMNEAYLDVKDLVLPKEFNDDSEEAMRAWIADNGMDAYQKVIMGGQRVDPNGVFYGGTAPSWSNRTVHEQLQALTASQTHVGMIDIHTGLGPFGHGDLIHAYPKGSRQYENLRSWYGEQMIGINAGEYGDVVAAVPRGPIVSYLDLMLPGKEEYAFVIEYGTLEFERVIRAVRADNWLHVHGDLNSPRGKEIKDEMRACFYSETDEWRTMIWERALWSIEKLAGGLASEAA